jgi:NADPH:quinone reductase
MKAITIPHRPCLPSSLTIDTSYPDPEPTPNFTSISIKAFGINHAEQYMRLGQWPESHEVPGIECVGVASACPSGKFAVGAKVAGIMGGLGRTVQGSYAEKVNVPDGNVVLLGEPGTGIDGEGVRRLSWAEVAAVPESYATAWSVISQNLEVKLGDRVLIRGATSALGTAALNLAAKSIGARVWTTTRQAARFQTLLDLGAEGGELEGPDLSARLREKGLIFDKVLDLIGNTVLLDSLKIPRRGGRVCQAGFLGGLGSIEFNPFTDMPSGVHLSFFGSFVYGTEEFPLSDVPLAGIVRDIAEGKWDARPSRVLKFEEVGEAHKHMEEGSAGGKMVVVV